MIDVLRGFGVQMILGVDLVVDSFEWRIFMGLSRRSKARPARVSKLNFGLALERV